MKPITAQEHKENGNAHFREKRYQQSIESYTEAIGFNSNEPTYFINRAMSYKELQNWENAYMDSTKAIELDDKRYKAFLINGISLIHLSVKDPTIERTEKGLLRIIKASKLSKAFKQEASIERHIRTARKFVWYKEKQLYEQQFHEYYPILKACIEGATGSAEIKQYWTENIYKGLCRARKSICIIPSMFLCPLTNKLMTNPVVTSEGYSYDLNALKSSIDKYGYYDPISKKPIKQTLIPNRNVRDAIEDFLNKNPWAYDYNPSDSLSNIQFI
jgi:STIP1 homology and U-box containing protein 1